MGIYLDRDLRRTQFVLAVARELHFGKAAARLNIAQSYLSREVKEFEDEQGYLFFERNGHYVAAVTDSGQAFIRTMGPVLDDLVAGFERASEMGRMISRQKAGSFLIGYSPLVPGQYQSRCVRFEACGSRFCVSSSAPSPRLNCSIPSHPGDFRRP